MNLHINYYGQGKALVFFHGWGFDSQIWLSLLPFLKNDYRLILVDLPGFGRSPMMNWAQFKKELLAQLPAQFILLGWSMGGLYATRLALEEPERIIRLFNITSSPRFTADTLWPGVNEELLANFYKNLSIDLNKTLQQFVALQLSKNPIIYSPEVTPNPEGLKSGLDLLNTWDLREALKNFKQPVCYMFGRLDPITPVKTMAVMQELYPDFKYVLFPRAAHMPFLSQPELFVKEILGFMQ